MFSLHLMSGKILVRQYTFYRKKNHFNAVLFVSLKENILKSLMQFVILHCNH